MSVLVQAFWREFSFAYLVIASTVLFVLAAEMAFPRETIMGHKHRVRVILFAVLAIPVSYLCGWSLSKAFNGLGLSPLLPPFGFADVILAVLLADFFYYWYHRAQHSIEWMWRVHSVHHSLEKMGAGTGYHHILEVPLNAALVTLPATALFGGRGGAITYLVVVLNGFYLHSTTRIHFGRFAWLLCDNRVHRIHHSRDQLHFSKNFGVITLVWDRLFGTAYLPKAGEWPEVGLSTKREPKTIRQWLSL